VSVTLCHRAPVPGRNAPDVRGRSAREWRGGILGIKTLLSIAKDIRHFPGSPRTPALPSLHSSSRTAGYETINSGDMVLTVNTRSTSSTRINGPSRSSTRYVSEHPKTSTGIVHWGVQRRMVRQVRSFYAWCQSRGKTQRAEITPRCDTVACV
jgi:hypothetical protein